MAIRIDGKEIAQRTREELLPRVEKLKQQGITPGLTVILVGEDPASAIYVRNKERTSKQLGFNGNVIRLPEDTSQQRLLAQVEELNRDANVHGILVQMPLPKHIDEAAVLKAIDPDKDVDGFHAVNAGRLFQGRGILLPCTPFGVMRMLKASGIDPSGKEAVIIGRSNIVGKPMAMLLLQADATVTIAHSRTKNLAEVARRADILVAAVGRAHFVTADMVKPGAAVIDVGVNRVGEKKVVGDVDFDAVEPIAGWITPVPGGVGPMTITMLMENTVLAAEQFAKHG